MAVEAKTAIHFTCERCKYEQFSIKYTLSPGKLSGNAGEGIEIDVMKDNILCEWCGHDNLVYQEL